MADTLVETMNKNVAVGYYDKTESLPTFHKKGDQDESRPEKRAKTVTDLKERSQDLEKSVEVPENDSLDAQENVHEHIERQRKEAGQDKLQKQSNVETDTHDQENKEQEKGVEKKRRDVRFRLEQFYNRQRMKRQQAQAQQPQKQQEQEPTQQQQQPLASHFNLYPLVEKLANAVETGTRDQNSDALVTELSSYFNKSQQMLNSVSGALGSKPMYVDGQKGKLEDTEKLLHQRRELIADYRKSIEDILKIKP